MRKNSIKIVAASLFCVFASNALAANTAPQTKSYQLLKLKEVVSNTDDCRSVYHSLKALKKSPLKFQFAHTDNTGTNFNLNDAAGKVQNHSYSIIEQKVSGHVASRIGMGNFVLDQKPIQYVLVIAGDADQQNFKYLYPVILSSDNSHCYFTGLLKPDSKTSETFKASIEQGAVSKKTDLAG